ncbi:hypothetical protein GCM10017668_54090 [Streptomyces tuirus]|uniref:Uncharacterized protein n=1 Tax=Streptomyces tuirus TaxID=68278 RepID=A0A7G1NPX5_9ACTN|nr:hypothetical protein GCM10017668_54090 [Streptomyces tuirus]
MVMVPVSLAERHRSGDGLGARDLQSRRWRGVRSLDLPTQERLDFLSFPLLYNCGHEAPGRLAPGQLKTQKRGPWTQHRPALIVPRSSARTERGWDGVRYERLFPESP